MYPTLKPLEKAFTPRNPTVRAVTSSNESLQVFCRLRPTDEKSSVRVLSDSTIRLTVPESSVNFRSGSCKEYQYSFKKVFTESADQKEVFDCVAKPLVENLIQGKNGLIFTYGVTGGGKTYTMSGGPDGNAGIMPRCFNIIFNSISDYQTKRFVFKPDKRSGFEVQSEEDIQREFNDFTRKKKLKKKEVCDNLFNIRDQNNTKVAITNEDNAYAVFVSYIEIYNEKAYDLLENFDGPDSNIQLQPQIVRVVGSHVWIHGLTIVEVKTAEEAYEIFRKGQERKQTADTRLNSESSRGHSVFTIRLVKAPLDVDGKNVLPDKNAITVSQLTLVDLAGSERTNRTKNSGQRLQESKSINSSLMTLRKCLEILRENQRTGGCQIIPYRDSRLTILFKNYFEKDGDIRMIVCVNPRVDDYDETIQVMKFAEASQEIMIKPTPLKPAPALGLTPGRRLNAALKNLNAQIEEEEDEEVVKKDKKDAAVFIPLDGNMIYNLEPFPDLEQFDPLDPAANEYFMKFLEERIGKKRKLLADLDKRVEKFRVQFIDQQEDALRLQQELNMVNATRECEQKKVETLENKVISQDHQVNAFKRQCSMLEEEKGRLKNLLETKEDQVQEVSATKVREKRANVRIAAKIDKLTKEKENNLKEKHQIERQLKDKEKQLKRVKKALVPQDDNVTRAKLAKFDTESESEITSSSQEAVVNHSDAEMLSKENHLFTSLATTFPLSSVQSNSPHCNTHDKWLDHRAAATAPMNTIFQPVMKRRKSFSKVTSPKDVTKNAKYCLTTQNQYEDGGVEMQLVKGNVVPTCGGGAQVIFKDVETLKQTSPVTSPVKLTVQKFSTPVTSPSNAAAAAYIRISPYPDVSSRCAISIEGHSQKKQ